MEYDDDAMGRDRTISNIIDNKLKINTLKMYLRSTECLKCTIIYFPYLQC